jgi:hypothetical protein
MAGRKFQNDDRVVGRDEAPASFRNRVGVVVDFKRPSGYGVRFDDRPECIEYVNPDSMARMDSKEQRQGVSS